jgi:hypothetical protein
MNKKLVSVVTAAAATVAVAWAGCGGGKTTGTGAASSSGHAGHGGGGATSSGLGGGGFGGGAGGSLAGILCNPVTNDGCTDGAACDFTQDPDTGQNNGFDCYAGPNDATVCQACDLMAVMAPFCAGGTTCFAVTPGAAMGACAKYCCTDADCGSGTCQTMGPTGPLFAAATSLGVCVASAASPDGGADGGGTDGGGADGGGAGGGGAGGGGAGGGGAGPIPLACTPPAVPPSMGSCVTVGK